MDQEKILPPPYATRASVKCVDTWSLVSGIVLLASGVIELCILIAKGVFFAQNGFHFAYPHNGFYGVFGIVIVIAGGLGIGAYKQRQSQRLVKGFLGMSILSAVVAAIGVIVSIVELVAAQQVVYADDLDPHNNLRKAFFYLNDYGLTYATETVCSYIDAILAFLAIACISATVSAVLSGRRLKMMNSVDYKKYLNDEALTARMTHSQKIFLGSAITLVLAGGANLVVFVAKIGYLASNGFGFNYLQNNYYPWCAILMTVCGAIGIAAAQGIKPHCLTMSCLVMSVVTSTLAFIGLIISIMEIAALNKVWWTRESASHNYFKMMFYNYDDDQLDFAIGKPSISCLVGLMIVFMLVGFVAAIISAFHAYKNRAGTGGVDLKAVPPPEYYNGYSPWSLEVNRLPGKQVLPDDNPPLTDYSAAGYTESFDSETSGGAVKA